MPSTVCVETTIVSYLMARLTRDVVRQAHQRVTREWWRTRRDKFELYVSPIVLQEAGAGDPLRSRRRFAALNGLPVLAPTPEAVNLARALVTYGPVPDQADVDAFHIAIATVHGVEYLLTWNCAHIANAQMRAGIESVCRNLGYEPPVLCTPEELMED